MLKIVRVTTDKQAHLMCCAKNGCFGSIRDRAGSNIHMSIVPIQRRTSNVANRPTVERRVDAPAKAASTPPPDRVPILMRMPDMSRVDGSQTLAPAGRSNVTAAVVAPPSTEHSITPPPRRSPGSERGTTAARTSDAANSTETRPTDPEVRPRPRRVKPRSTSPQARHSETSFWLQPSHLLIGAAVVAVIISVIAMIRRPEQQPNNMAPPAWNAGGAAAPTPLSPAAPVGNGTQPLGAQPQPAPAAPVNAAPAAPTGPTPNNSSALGNSAAPSPGAWSTDSQPAPASQNTPQPELKLPQPDPGQWPAQSAANVAPVGAPTGTPAAALTGTIDKPEQPTLRAQHERIGQGIH